MLAQLGATPDDPRLKAGVDYLIAHPARGRLLVRPLGRQLHLRHLVGAGGTERGGLDARSIRPCARAPTGWSAIQNPDGGWGENCDSYKLDYKGYEPAPSTASQTAWALLGLMAAGQVDHPAVARGIAYLKAHAGSGRAVEPAALYRRRISARVLSQLSRLSEILPALGAGALPQSEDRQFAPGANSGCDAFSPSPVSQREAEYRRRAGVVAVAGGGDASLADKLDALHGDIAG